MSTKLHEMQRLIRYYKDETKQTEINMRDVVKFAISRRLLKIPPPTDPIDRLAREFAQAAREEVRYDKKTGKPYRANLPIPGPPGTQLHLWTWVDIDEAPRKHVVKNLIMRRERMVGDGLQLTLDADHWNNVHPDEEPIVIPLDFTDDIMWRKNAPEEKEAS